MRGEYEKQGEPLGPSWELPPRARRIREGLENNVFAHGTTSACAENTAGHGAPGETGRNYLRVRGEYGGADLAAAPARELPPRARRIRHLGGELGHGIGTTSACAENTEAMAALLIRPRNYLRVRGEYSLT